MAPSARLPHFLRGHASPTRSVLGGSPVTRDSPEQLDVALILKDLRLDANLSESKRLACAVQNRLVLATRDPGRREPAFRNRNRGVRQALFHVLL